MKKVSIVIAYYNRHSLLLNTLESIKKTNYTNYEIIIVNDASDDIDIIKNKVEDNNKIKIIDIDITTKSNRTNPCSVFNIGFKYATGDIIIIQNPESYHIGDIISYTATKLKEREYIVFPAYNLHSEKANNKFMELEEKTYNNIINPQYIPTASDKHLWYHHEKYRKCYYHFCSAIFRKDLEMVGYFDDNYKYGVCFDDDDLVLKIRDLARYNMYTPNPQMEPFIVNMWHSPSLSTNIDTQPDTNNIKQKWLLNKKYYENKKMSLNKNFTYPRILHLYWYGKMSFLNYLTVVSFHKYHPAWIINIYTTNKSTTSIQWNTHEQKGNSDTEDYTTNLYKLSYVNIINIDQVISELKINDKNCVHQSDIIRVYYLYKYGGIWSDFDIIYIKNIEELFINKSKPTIFQCRDQKTGNIYYPVGFFISNPQTYLFEQLHKKQKDLVQSNNFKEYQTYGSELLKSMLNTNNFKQHYDNYGKEYYLYFAWNELNELFNKLHIKFHKNTFGIHWFNGSILAKRFIDKFKKSDFKIKTTIEYLINEYLEYIN